MYNKKDSLLDVFLKDSYKPFSVREAGRLAGVSPMTASLTLHQLEKEGFLTSRRERRALLYQAATENNVFRDRKVYENIRRLRAAGVVEHLEQALDGPEAIILFGSFSKGENRKESDIDIFVLAASKRKPDLTVYEKRLGAEIQLFLTSRQGMQRMMKENPELLNSILNGVRLSGYVEVFR